MTAMTGCSLWLYLALVIGVLICLADPIAWTPPIRPYSVFRWFLCIVIVVLGIICFLR